LLVTGGAGALGPAVRWATRAPALDLRALEVLLRDEDDLARNAQRWVAALDAVDADLSDVPTFVELPPCSGGLTRGWLFALDEIAAAGLQTKVRVTEDDAFLLEAIDAALDRELPVKVAGLRRATTGPEGLGFLNVLAATRACLDGADPGEALRSPTPTSPYDDEVLLRTRRWLAAVSCQDIHEALDDLVELGLVTPE
jgi:hypothetical protein